MSCCACCCFYPKYKRKVDNIFPRNPESNLVKNEIDKLQYYSCQHPEKLSKIGDYLYQNLKWGLNGSYKNKNYVRNTIEAVDKILVVIGPESLNFYANSYLKMIQKLLEQPDLDYQKMATNSFKKFCEKESTNQAANFNRNYDQFVCQFSAMCYNNNKDSHTRSEIRVSGLQGVGAMVKKIQPDESLQATYLWDNMDKIVSALLFIMQEGFNEQRTSLNRNQQMLQSPSVSQLTQPEGDYFSKIGAITDDATVTINNERSSMAPTTNNNTLLVEKIRVQVHDEENIELRLLSSHENLNNNAAASLQVSSATPPPNYDSENYTRGCLDASIEAKNLLKEISMKADYTTINKIVRPLLTYMDQNNGWPQLDFIDCVFQTVMHHVKQQHAIVIKELIKHLDSHRNSDAQMKTFIIKAISICIQISALHSVGTTANIIDIFTNLLKHLNFSLEKSSMHFLSSTTSIETINRGEEVNFQNEILETMKNFTSQLPDYAKNDVIMFITKQIISHQYSYSELVQQQDKQASNAKDQLNEQMRNKYLDALYEICTKYKPTHQVFGAFTSVSFLEDILRLIIMFDSQSRRKSNEILQYLLDKYNLTSKIKQFYHKRQQQQQLLLSKKPVDLSNMSTASSTSPIANSLLDLLDFNLKPNKEDTHFMRKFGRLFLSHLNESLFIKTNVSQNYESLFITVVFFLIGINDKEFLIDLIAFGLHIQYIALCNYKELKFNLKCEIMSFLTAYFDFIVRLYSNVPLLSQYVNRVISIRRTQCYVKHLYPTYVYQTPTVTRAASISASLNSLNKLNEFSNEEDFNREYDELAKEFIDSIEQKQPQQENDSDGDDRSNLSRTSSKARLNESSITTTGSTTDGVVKKKTTNWLFDKQTIAELLNKSGLSLQRINQSFSTEFSLATTYLSSAILSQSHLKYRSIHNLSNGGAAGFMNPSESNANIPNQRCSLTNRSVSSLKKSGSGVGSIQPGGAIGGINHLNDSFETSYDSASQVSESDILENKCTFIVGNNDDAQSYNKLSFLQTLAKQDSDVLSFDTIKRYLLNNTNAATYLPATNAYSTGSTQSTTNVTTLNGADLYQTLQSNRDMFANLDTDNDEMKKIMNDFSKKTFDEVRGDLAMKTSQQNDKYKKVMDLLNKDPLQQHSASALSQQVSSSSILSNILDKAPFQQQDKQLQQQQLQAQKQLVPLNDIEFPHLFMY